MQQLSDATNDGMSKTFHQPVFRKCLVLCAMFQVARVDTGISAASRQAVQLTGRLELNAFDSNRRPWTTMNTRFTATSAQGSWLLRVDFGTSHFLIHGCDGIDTFTILYGSSKGTNAITSQLLPAHIDSGVYPHNAQWYSTIPWLAFLSDGYLATNAAQVMPFPFQSSRHDPTAHIYRYNWEPLGPESRLPKAMSFVSKSDLLTTALNHPELLASNHLASPTRDLALFAGDFLGGDYQVEEMTNFAGRVFPLRFVARRYAPKGKEDGLVQRVTGIVDSMLVTNVDSFQPRIDRPLAVADYRLRARERRVDFGSYQLAGSQWPETNSPIVVRAFERSLAAADRATGRNADSIGTYRILFLSAMLFCLIVGLRAVLVRGYLGRKPNPQ
jgi:hypothetical protein